MAKSKNAKSENVNRTTPAQAMTRGIAALSWQVWAGIGLLIALTTLVYLPAMGGGALLDDDLLLTQNKLVHSRTACFNSGLQARLRIIGR